MQDTFSGWPSEDNAWPFLRDPTESLVLTDEDFEGFFRRDSPSNADILPDFQSYCLTNNLDFYSNSTFFYSHIPPETVKLLLPEVCHPHSQESCTIFGIPFPTCIRNVIVPPLNEVDAWNNYYFAEDPDVRPYVAGLTCVPDVDLMIPY